MKKFNITGVCIPHMHYMVDITNKIEEIKKLIVQEEYFTINRARQYGKTTVINQLYHALKNNYLVIETSFEGVGNSAFKNEKSFSKFFLELIEEKTEIFDENLASYLLKEIKTVENLKEVSKILTKYIERSNKEVILIIDEVDKSSDNQIFLNFIGMLRTKYLDRNKGTDKTFKSVILAGVYDIKNLKLKLRQDAEKKYNSPWNIAANFTVDLSFNPKEISSMLIDYEKDAMTDMDITEMSRIIYEYTNGYPFLVSRLCKAVDEELNKKWTKEGLEEAVKLILAENNTLYDDIIKNLENNTDMYDIIYSLIIEGKEFSYNLANPILSRLIMYSIIGKNGEGIKVHNRIFEKYLYNYLISKTETSGIKIVNYTKNQFFDEYGNLLMERVLNKFQELMKEEYRDKTESFVEKEGRLIFLAFIKPVINGEGLYFVEPETRNNNRMDIIITLNRKQYIIELKKWYGKEYEDDGYEQLAKYLGLKNEKTGYMVMFDFRKRDKEYKRGRQEVDGKSIYEVVV